MYSQPCLYEYDRLPKQILRTLAAKRAALPMPIAPSLANKYDRVKNGSRSSYSSNCGEGNPKHQLNAPLGSVQRPKYQRQ